RGTTYRLRRREAVPLGLRRVTRQEIEEAVARLRGGTDEPLADAIHGARKGFKRLRALVRLARGELGDDAYRRENATFRDAGRAPPRAAQARQGLLACQPAPAAGRSQADGRPGEAAAHALRPPGRGPRLRGAGGHRRLPARVLRGRRGPGRLRHAGRRAAPGT